MTYKRPRDLGAAYRGLSDVEINLLEHRMFAEVDKGIIGAPGVKIGALFSVNFMPGNMEIPLLVKWISPDNEVVTTQHLRAKYMENLVVSFSLPAKGTIYGTWHLKFFFEGNKIGGQNMLITSPGTDE